ncbi:MAG: hypothetical protein QOE03_3361 [Micromonosporaceae bacterium]|nr:hypothetical protein [Micromonosporaceae bacterium]
MPRSITGTSLGRSPLRFAAPLAAAVAAALLSGCGAGQISQTDTMVPAVPGANVDSPSGLVSIRNATISYNPTEYPTGSSAPLVIYIVNNSLNKAVALRGVTATDKPGGLALGTVLVAGGAADVEIIPGPSASAMPTGSPSADAPASPSATAAPSETAAPSAAGSPSASAPTARGPGTGGAALNVVIPPNRLVRLAPTFGAYLVIAGLRAPVGPDSSVYLTFNVVGDEPFGTTVSFGEPTMGLPRLAPSGTPAAG